MVDHALLNDTLQKINASLNKRFEKNADLYISRQDEYEIKKNLCNEAYGGVVDMAKAKGISHDIVVKVLLRNAGVMNVTDIGRFRKELAPILQDANYEALQYMMEDVLGSNVFMPKDVRRVLFSYYMGGMSSERLAEYWDNEEKYSFDARERSELYNLIISKTKQADPSQTLKRKITFMNQAFERFPSILEDKDAMLKLKASLDDGEQLQFFRHLCSEMQVPSINDETYNFVLEDTYASYGGTAFNDAVNQIKSYGCSKKYVTVICRMLWTEKDKNTLCNMFDTVYKIFNSSYIQNPSIKREINQKVWKAAKKNAALYQERKAMIDKLLSELEKTDEKKYTSFSDISTDIKDHAKPQSIAYLWANMKPGAFEESLEKSFTELDASCIGTMREIYTWLFRHSERRGAMKGLKTMCGKVAVSLYHFASSGKQSALFDAMDKCWLETVISKKLGGENINIKRYMFEFHFDRVKEWQ